MWVKLDDGYTEHLKLFEAGRNLGGRSGYARALAVDIQGICYANRAESDGFVPEFVVKSLHDPRPLDVAHVLVMVRRWHEVSGGFKIHDYEVYQPLAADLKAKRRKDLERKQRGKVTLVESSFRAESAQIPLSPDPVPFPSLKKDHGRAARAECENPVENLDVLTALIWREVHAASLDPQESWDLLSVLERVKTVAARARLVYAVDTFRDQVETAFARVAQRRRTA
ncbi:MAG TPA: hypothetical protein VNJ04_08165 [Gemmatimonadaceae bacterium]|nr:hypothetical protein [Gemmatimonadaceae bacterium]